MFLMLFCKEIREIFQILIHNRCLIRHSPFLSKNKLQAVERTCLGMYG